MRIILLIVSSFVLMASCQQKSKTATTFHNPDLYCTTVKMLNNVVLENNFPPMIAARNYVYACIAGYECMAAGDSSYQSLAQQIKHLPSLPSPASKENIDFALAAMLAFTKVGNAVSFPEGSLMEYHADLLAMADSIGLSPEKIQATITFSDTIASSILIWSKGDAYGKTRGESKYEYKDIEGRWIPTPPMYSTGIEPHWKKIRPMILDSASQFEIPRPPVWERKDIYSACYQSLLEVKNMGDSLTAEQKAIAEFWDDNPFKMNVSGHVMYATKKFSPPGHWLNIVGIAAKKAKADFKATLAAYAITSIAFYDAFIRAWEEKYKSNYVRPETIINKYLDPYWRPYIQTPPFPSYVSGHATNSAAAAEAMTSCFGDSLSFVDTSLVAFGIPARKILSFRKAAEEAALSRLYGGIHYRFDNEEGLKVGKKVGQLVVARLKLKK
ncbi:MAG: vanadium-dependent haloperoxidase [Bacteroidota bacterium]